jgi:hypothetical protein
MPLHFVSLDVRILKILEPILKIGKLHWFQYAPPALPLSQMCAYDFEKGTDTCQVILFPNHWYRKMLENFPHIIYHIFTCLGSSVCHPVIFLSSCHSCGTLCYSLCFSNQTDQGDKTEGFEREGYRWRDRKGRDWRGRVWRHFSLYKPNLINMNVHSATCSCSVGLYKQWFILADFFPKLGFSRGFLYN